jgi:hypothetical protein
MRWLTFTGVAALVAGALIQSFDLQPARAATISLGTAADTYLRDATVRGGFAFMDVRGAAIDFRGYARFDLSSLGPINITSASMKYTWSGGASRNDAMNSGRFAAYGLNNVLGNTPQNWDEATFVPASKGTEDVTTLTGVTDLDDNVAGISEVFVGGGVVGDTVTVSGAPLVAFLQSRVGDGGLATFILSNDDATDRGFGLASKENATEAYRPVLTLEYEPAVPEPTALVLAACAAAFGTAVRRRRK